MPWCWCHAWSCYHHPCVDCAQRRHRSAAPKNSKLQQHQHARTHARTPCTRPSVRPSLGASMGACTACARVQGRGGRGPWCRGGGGGGGVVKDVPCTRWMRSWRSNHASSPAWRVCPLGHSAAIGRGGTDLHPPPPPYRPPTPLSSRTSEARCCSGGGVGGGVGGGGGCCSTPCVCVCTGCPPKRASVVHCSSTRRSNDALLVNPAWLANGGTAVQQLSHRSRDRSGTSVKHGIANE
eukprot:COSAG01_NODE_3919_length_5537_cov_3.626333_3_plen_237_part_00